jgi:hypothetical protein
MKHRGSTWQANTPDVSEWIVYFHHLSYTYDNAIFRGDARRQLETTLVPKTGPELLFQGSPVHELQAVEAASLYPALNRTHLDFSTSSNHGAPSSTVAVHLTNSCPWLCRYRVALNSARSEQKAGRLEWKLRPGPNSIEVRAVNELGVAGPASRVELTFTPPLREESEVERTGQADTGTRIER